METITRMNGNGKKYTTNLPLLIICTSHYNDVALNWIKENTGLEFKKANYGYTAQPTESNQIATLLMLYNFKTKYYNNWQYSNTLLLKSDHNTGFDVEHICYDCCVSNNISIRGLKPGDKLQC